MLFPLADFKFTSHPEYLSSNPLNFRPDLTASNSSECPSFQILEIRGRGSDRLSLSLQLFLGLDPLLGYHVLLSSCFLNSTTLCTKNLLNSSLWVQSLSATVTSRSPTRRPINIRSHIQRMGREIRAEPAIDKRNNLYYQSRNLLDAIAARLQQFRREGTVPDDDWLCAQADYGSLHGSIKFLWIGDYDGLEMATNGGLLTPWEENPAHQEEAPQDAMEEESQARRFEREARATLDGLVYRQMSAKGDGEEPQKDGEESKENKEPSDQ
ncbi:hypothetical protein DL768_004137 [Monosporascus sp. mg162]|nr:hypothetical protein DL768_004137 [Monosporascus sp. mg162]